MNKIYETNKQTNKREVAIIRMYIAPPISNLAISDQGNSLSWKWFKVDKGEAHSLCKIMQFYAFLICLNFLIVKLQSFLPKDVKKNHTCETSNYD